MLNSLLLIMKILFKDNFLKISKMSESNMHYYSKIVVSSWLRKMVGKNCKGMNNLNIETVDKKFSPMFDVYTEYPVCFDQKTRKIVGLCRTSDTKLNGACCIWEDWFEENPEFKVKAKSKIPTSYEIKQNMKNRLTILYLFDIGVIDNGKLKYAFEIEYKHPIDDKKAKFIEKHQITTYEISAEWIMNLTRDSKYPIPYDVECKRKFEFN